MFPEDRVRLVSLRELYAFYDSQDHAFTDIVRDPDARIVTLDEVRPCWWNSPLDAAEVWNVRGLNPLMIGALHLQRHGRPLEYVDVGANVGLTVFGAAIFFKRLGFDVPVAAFEPHPGVYDLLRRGIAANGLSGAITAYDVALSDRSGEASFHVTPAQTPASSLLDAAVTREYVQGFQDVRVQVRRFDQLIAHRPDRDLVVKIDAEGYDFKVLDGMGELTGPRSCLIQIEFFPMLLTTYSDPCEYLTQIEKHFALFDVASASSRAVGSGPASLAAYVAEVASRRPLGAGDLLLVPRALPGFDDFCARILDN